jgi:hypothetical protein
MSTNNKSKAYTMDSLVQAVQSCLDGSVIKFAAKRFNIPYNTLKRKVKLVKNNGGNVDVLKGSGRTGPKTMLPTAIEQDLHDWVAAMQKNGTPVSRATILKKGREIKTIIHRQTRSSEPLSEG